MQHSQSSSGELRGTWNFVLHHCFQGGLCRLRHEEPRNEAPHTAPHMLLRSNAAHPTKNDHSPVSRSATQTNMELDHRFKSHQSISAVFLLMVVLQWRTRGRHSTGASFQDGKPGATLVRNLSCGLVLSIVPQATWTQAVCWKCHVKEQRAPKFNAVPHWHLRSQLLSPSLHGTGQRHRQSSA